EPGTLASWLPIPISSGYFWEAEQRLRPSDCLRKFAIARLTGSSTVSIDVFPLPNKEGPVMSLNRRSVLKGVVVSAATAGLPSISQAQTEPIKVGILTPLTGA